MEFSSFNENNKRITREDINKITGFNPINVLFYQQAFIHKSVLRFLESCEIKNSYERYEFLGDSILNLIVAKLLFKKYPEKEEGFLTRIRTKLVNGKTLSKLAKKISLGDFLIISQNVENIGGRNNDRILEDVFESFLCSINMDLGYNYVENFVLKLIYENIDFSELEEDTNYKDILLRYCQQKFQSNPRYEIVETTGPAHKKSFTSIVLIKDDYYSKGSGVNKKISEQNASKLTLEKFGFNFN
tara:strand:- start:2729 stop:3460 length:732 start_codon:yes stop_codon:yes gene_type:complete